MCAIQKQRHTTLPALQCQFVNWHQDTGTGRDEVDAYKRHPRPTLTRRVKSQSEAVLQRGTIHTARSSATTSEFNGELVDVGSNCVSGVVKTVFHHAIRGAQV